MKSLLPLLIAAKVKLGVLATLSYFIIGLIAKKAIFASLIAIAISGFIGLKSLWAGKGSYDVTGYNSAWGAPIGGGWSGPVGGGWSGGVSSGWEDPHAYSHSQAYSGYHH